MQATRIAKGAVLLAVLLLSAEPAQAVKARRLRLEDLRAQAVSVVFGQVLAVTQRLDDKGMVWTDYALEVTETLAGVNPGPHTVISFAGGTLGGRSLAIPGMPRLAAGSGYVFFLHPEGTYPNPTVGWGQGLFRFEHVRVGRTHTEILVSYDGEPLEMSADHRLMRGRRIEIANGMIVEPPTMRREDLGPPVSPGNFVAADGTVVPQPPPVSSREPRAARARAFASLGDLRLFLQGKLECVNEVSPDSRSSP